MFPLLRCNDVSYYFPCTANFKTKYLKIFHKPVLKLHQSKIDINKAKENQMEYRRGYKRQKKMEGNKMRARAISATLTCSEELLR